MKKVNISAITPDMVCGADIYGKDKKLIVGEGTKFSDEIVSDLLVNGISEVSIETKSEINQKYKKVFDEYNVGDLDELKDEIIRRQDVKFKKYISNPLMKKLYDASLKFLLNKYDIHQQ